jgi:glutamine synthetase
MANGSGLMTSATPSSGRSPTHPEEGPVNRLSRVQDKNALLASQAFDRELTDAAVLLKSQDVRGIYFTLPSVDGRALAKFITLDNFVAAARSGVRFHYGSIADARANLFGELIGFGESATEGIGIPDLSTLAVLPWQPTCARVLCFVYSEETGCLLEHDSRANLLRNEAALTQATGLRMRCAIEPEVMWLKRDAHDRPAFSTRSLSVYGASNFHDHEPTMLELLSFCAQLGLKVRGVDSEESSQLEVNQEPAGPLDFADAYFTYRQVCRVVAQRHGLLCTFMPKPFMGESGNGAHHNLSLVDADGQSVMIGDWKGPCRLSPIAAHFVGGLLEHADALTMIGAPTVNSYKRFWDVGHWAAFCKAFGYNNRTCLVRIPTPGRIEVRHFDSAANAYHTLAGCLGAGLDGILNEQDPGEPVSDNVMTDVRIDRTRRIPLTLNEAIEAFETDELMRTVYPPMLRNVLLALREDEWQRYWAQISQWEMDFYLERWP